MKLVFVSLLVASVALSHVDERRNGKFSGSITSKEKTDSDRDVQDMSNFDVYEAYTLLKSVPVPTPNISEIGMKRAHDSNIKYQKRYRQNDESTEVDFHDSYRHSKHEHIPHTAVPKWLGKHKNLAWMVVAAIVLVLLCIKFKTFVVRLLLKIIIRLYYVIVYDMNLYGYSFSYPMKWNLLSWNFLNWKQASKLNMLVEWNYHMLFTEEVIGSFGICVINPNKLPLVPTGMIFMAYGTFRKTGKPFTLYRIVPLTKSQAAAGTKHWPASPENPF